MKDKYINIQIPILDGVNGMEVVKTFTEEQLWYVCAIAKAFEELQEENQKYKEVINKANDKLNSFIECCKAEKLESGSDYLHHLYWDMFERFNQIKDILKEVE